MDNRPHQGVVLPAVFRRAFNHRLAIHQEKRIFFANSPRSRRRRVQSLLISATLLPFWPIQDAAAQETISGNVTIDRPLELSGGDDDYSAEPGQLHSVSGNNVWAGPILLAGYGDITVSTDRLTITGPISTPEGISGGLLRKNGPGELAIAGPTVNFSVDVENGFLTIQTNNINYAPTVFDGATAQIRGNVNTGPVAGMRLAGRGTSGQGALYNFQGNNTFGGPVSLANPAHPTIGAAAGTTLTLSGVISSEAPPFTNDPPFAPLIKVGPGTLALTAENTYRGGTFVNAGALSISSNAALGDASDATTVNNGAKLLIAADFSTARTFNLNTGAIQVEAGKTLSYAGATVAGGFLRGPGTHAITSVSSFGGVTSLPGTNIVQNAATALANFTNSGQLISNAPLVWDGGYNTSAGQVTVNSTLIASAFENGGSILITSGATLFNSGSPLTSGGGSNITINQGGTLQLNGTSLDLRGALAVNNGSIAGGLTNVYFGSLLTGTGEFGTVQLHPGGTFTPGQALNVVPNTSTHTALILTTGGDQSISSPLRLLADTLVTIPSETLRISGIIDARGRSFTKLQAGTLEIDRILTDDLSIEAGTLRILPHRGSPTPSVANELAVGASSLLDLTNNALILRSSVPSDLAAVREQIIQGRSSTAGVANGKWDGSTGITSSTAAQAFIDNNKETLAIGYALNSDLLTSYTTFLGQPVSESDILIRLTKNGDANLDGVVNNNDITILAGFYRPGTTGRHWYQADFNYDGETNNNDITILAGFYAPNAPPLSASPSALSVVPEPTFSCLLFPLAILFARRK